MVGSVIVLLNYVIMTSNLWCWLHGVSKLLLTKSNSVSVDAKAQTDNDEERGSRKDKFATERQRITAPESSGKFLITLLQI